MIEIKIETTVIAVATTNDTSGAAVAADSTPTCNVLKNGVQLTTGLSMAAVSGDTGCYTISYAVTVSNGFSAGDKIDIIGIATVGGVTSKAVIYSAMVSTYHTDDVYGKVLDATDVRSAVGLTSANLDTQLSTIDDYLDTEVSAIKSKTENLPSSPAATGDPMTLAPSTDVYWAQIDFEPGTTDKYTVSWTKNGVVQTSGMTNPKIKVTLRDVSGTDLIPLSSMTAVGATGAFFYDETVNKVSQGTSVIVDVEATIDAATRTARRIVRNP